MGRGATRPHFEDGIEAHERRIQGVLRWAYDDQGWEPVSDRTPLDDMLAEEPEVEFDGEVPGGAYSWPSSESPDLELTALKAEEAAQVAEWARKRMMDWLAGEGVHPFKVIQRFYSMCYVRYPHLIGPLNGEWIAQILGQGRAAFSACVQRLFNKHVEAKTGQVITVGGQKNAASREKYASNAAAKKPRRQMNNSGLGAHEAEVERLSSEEARKEKLRHEQMLNARRLDEENERFFREAKARRIAAEAKAEA